MTTDLAPDRRSEKVQVPTAPTQAPPTTAHTLKDHTVRNRRDLGEILKPLLEDWRDCSVVRST